MSGLRCVTCGSEKLIVQVPDPESYCCRECGSTYESVWGVPFFGSFEGDDLLGLIEIAANISNRGNFGVNPKTVESWEQLLSDYHQAEDKKGFIEKNSEAQSPYFMNRYGEWLEINHLLRDVDLSGLKVLDIGAGLGFDSHRLAMRRTDVTALEFSPLLAEAGNINFPHIRWIGGFSHCLPFKDAGFDAVFCNAALHHMKDIPATLSESLRVLKPGGKLFTTCDSFRANDTNDDVELEIFNNNPAVLLGVNEGVPKFSEYTSILQQYSDFIDVELFTHTLHSHSFNKPLQDLTSWDYLNDNEMLGQSSGSLAMQIRLKKPWPCQATLQTAELLSAGRYADSLSSESSAMGMLASIMPDCYVDLPFLGEKGTKFELLNGWRLQKKFQSSRTAYRRGRWFLRKKSTDDFLFFEARLPFSAIGPVPISVFLNGENKTSCEIDSEQWCRVSVDLSKIPVDQVFAIEIHMQGGGNTLETGSFLVRNRKYKKQHPSTAISEDTSGTPWVYAVIPVFNRFHFTLKCIQDLKAQTYKNIQIIVSDGGSTDGTVDLIQEKFQDIVVLTCDKELWWTGAMAQGIDHAIRASQGADGFVLMMNNDTQIPEDYVASLVAASTHYGAAVGSIVVDSRDTSIILDAGEYINWESYSFPVNTHVDPDDDFRDDVDVLPGRGSLVPLEMIRVAGNVDATLLPHYLADYEFFYRLKQHEFRLGVCCDTKLLAHIEETGIVPGTSKTSFIAVFKELFSRRSMTNVVDHWRFVKRHAPKKLRLRVQLHLIMRTIGVLLLRTPMRPFVLPVLWLCRMPVQVVKAQRFQFSIFLKKMKSLGTDILCHPGYFPSLIRLPVYIFMSPGPFDLSACTRHGLDRDELIEQGVLRRLDIKGWYSLETLKFSKMTDSKKLRRLFWNAWNPIRKFILLLRLIKEL